MFGHVTTIEVASYLGTSMPQTEQALTLVRAATEFSGNPVVLDLTGFEGSQDFWNAFMHALPQALYPWAQQLHQNVYLRYTNASPEQRQFISTSWNSNKYLVRQD